MNGLINKFTSIFCITRMGILRLNLKIYGIIWDLRIPVLRDLNHFLINKGTYRRRYIVFCDTHHLKRFESGVIFIVVKEELTIIQN